MITTIFMALGGLLLLAMLAMGWPRRRWSVYPSGPLGFMLILLLVVFLPRRLPPSGHSRSAQDQSDSDSDPDPGEDDRRSSVKPD